MYDWNDLRHFLAVARSGSTLAASKALDVNPTTIARRIAALEEALDVRLFDRLQAGYRLTEDGEALRIDAERVEAEARVLQDRLHARRRRTAGAVRVTTNETMANAFLTPCLLEFADLYPDIRVELLVSDQHVDLLRGEADIAIRGGGQPDGGGLVIRKISDVAWGLFCSREYAARRGCPREVEDLGRHAIIQGEGAAAFLPGVRWLERYAPGAETPTRSNSLSNLVVAVKAGLGVGILPCFIGDADPQLIRCLAPIPELQSHVWQITPESLRDLPRVRAFNDFVAARAFAVRSRMIGMQPQPAVAA